MKKTTLFVVASLSLGMIACGPSLTTAGARAKVASAEEVAACRPVSSVKGSGSSKEAAEVSLRHKAGAMNVDRVVVTDTAEGSDGVMLTGQAYSCSSAQAAPAQP